jgi:hypothetical protein
MLELPSARRVGETVRADRACSAGCVAATLNPAVGAARAALLPTRIVLLRRFVP